MPTILSLDISKKNTGYSIVCYDLDTQSARFIASGAIKIPNSSNYSKFYFRAKDHLVHLISEVFDLYAPLDLIAVESPIFHSTSSELQFYFFQETLRFAHCRGIDAVGYSPMLLKSFAKQWATVPTSRVPDKAELYRIYVDHVYPVNQDILPELDISTSDDQVDAVYLGMMALLAQGRISQLPPIPQELSYQSEWLRHPDGGFHYFFPDSESLHKVFVQGGLTHVKDFRLPLLTPKALPLSKFAQDLRRNGFLKLSMPFHYPFARLKGLSAIYRHLMTVDQPNTIKALTKRLKKTPLDTLLNTRSQWSLAMDFKGDLFLDSPTPQQER